MSDERSDTAGEVEAVNLESESPKLALVDVWDSSRDPFNEWVLSVSQTFYESGLGIEMVARFLDTTPGELAAVLVLATMEEDDLSILAEDVPPKTTWFAFANATTDEIVAGLKALDDMSSDDAPHAVVKGAFREVSGPRPEENVAELPGKVFFHMSTKAKQYGLLSGKSRKFLFDMGKRRRADYDMSPAQADYACDLLEQLADKGAVTRGSPDDDQDICNQVLDALRR
ncbi:MULTISPECIES: hypothetical protein [Haloferax]|uniref:Uncharacterized protein n=2 Tax=Haloferax TaxID=2251 RepID=A0A6G1Z6Y7_9EURY|nr:MULTISPECIES: hypothetical protein [Haloferax]KAB1184766.1 hypothetical protein Hfx1149_17015 [Haloferax sp. CBA1149]MRW82397.1 hypothetical protein [Haloferax marinisediminis]